MDPKLIETVAKGVRTATGRRRAPVRRLARSGGRLLRPRQDGHRPAVDGRLRRAAAPRGPGLPPAAAAGPVGPAHLPDARRRRGPAGPGPRRRAAGLTGWEQRRISRHRPRDAHRGGRARSSTTRRSSSCAMHQEAGRKVFIVSASPEEIVAPLAQYLGADEAIATRAVLDERRALHGRGRALLLRPREGPHAAPRSAERDGIDLGGVLRLLRLGDRRADAGGGRTRHRRQPRPGAGADRPDPGLGDRDVLQPGPAARAGGDALGHRPRGGHVGDRGGDGRGGGRLVYWRERRRPPRRRFLGWRDWCTRGVPSWRPPWPGHEGDDEDQLLHGAERRCRPVPRRVQGRRRRCPSTWWAPPPSKRLARAIPVRRVRFPSTSAIRTGVGPPRQRSADRSDGQQVAAPALEAGWRSLRHRPGLDLADPLAGEVEGVAHLLEGAGLAAVEAVAQAQDLALALVEVQRAARSTSPGRSAVGHGLEGRRARGPRPGRRARSRRPRRSGSDSDSGSVAKRSASVTLSSARSSSAASSATVAGRPSSSSSGRGPAGPGRAMSPACTGRRIVRPVLAMPRVIAWRIHHVA